MKTTRRLLLALVAGLATAVVATVLAASATFNRHNAQRYDAILPVDLRAEMKTADLEAGRRIVHIRSGCIECHGHDLGGKVFIDGPPGRIAAPNITPAALASWSDGEIARAIRSGVGRSHEPLLIMPSENFQHLSKQDLASTVAYLRSVPPVQKQTPERKIGLLMKTLYLLGKMPNLFSVELVDAKDTEFAGKPQEAATAEFGKYMVKNSCLSCHGQNRRADRFPAVLQIGQKPPTSGHPPLGAGARRLSSGR